jgi:protein phosphatase
MRSIYHGTYAYKTDIGKVRTANEDQAMVLTNAYGEVFLIVCDGMGGANKGDLASQLAIDAVTASFRHKHKHVAGYLDQLWITRACKEANKVIYDQAEKNPDCKGMGTTLVCALISGNKIMTANIGDSRAYRVTLEAIDQLTEDQTYVHFLVKTGKITPVEALTHPDRHVLMNALGIYPSVSLTINEYPYAGETILLCSDGLYNQVEAKQIHSILLTDERADQKVQSLISIANNNGGSDNIGVSYWESIDHD